MAWTGSCGRRSTWPISSDFERGQRGSTPRASATSRRRGSASRSCGLPRGARVEIDAIAEIEAPADRPLADGFLDGAAAQAARADPDAAACRPWAAGRGPAADWAARRGWSRCGRARRCARRPSSCRRFRKLEPSLVPRSVVRYAQLSGSKRASLDERTSPVKRRTARRPRFFPVVPEIANLGSIQELPMVAFGESVSIFSPSR